MNLTWKSKRTLYQSPSPCFLWGRIPWALPNSFEKSIFPTKLIITKKFAFFLFYVRFLLIRNVIWIIQSHFFFKNLPCLCCSLFLAFSVLLTIMQGGHQFILKSCHSFISHIHFIVEKTFLHYPRPKSWVRKWLFCFVIVACT